MVNTDRRDVFASRGIWQVHPRARKQVSNLFSLCAKQELRHRILTRYLNKALYKHAHERKLALHPRSLKSYDESRVRAHMCDSLRREIVSDVSRINEKRRNESKRIHYSAIEHYEIQLSSIKTIPSIKIYMCEVFFYFFLLSKTRLDYC